jgi:hypothetical protein
MIPQSPAMRAKNDLARLKSALAQHPDLGIDGFRHMTRRGPYPSNDAEFAERRAMFMEPEYLRQIDTAYEYLNHFDIDKHTGSYGLKHLMENWGRENGLESYVTNGCAILAAILAGYQIVRQRNSPNCTFRSLK